MGNIFQAHSSYKTIWIKIWTPEFSRDFLPAREYGSSVFLRQCLFLLYHFCCFLFGLQSVTSGYANMAKSSEEDVL